MLNTLWAACVAVLVTSPQAPGGGIAIERVEPGRWRATYTFPTPVTALRFERAAAHHREQVWTVATPAYRWSRAGDAQILQLEPSATPASTITFNLSEFTDPLPKEYELFQPFTDGAVAIYTGHFYAVPEGPAFGDSAPALRTLRVTPPPGAHAVVRGRVVTGSVDFTDAIGEGTYVYVGSARPIETPNLVAIVDPGMPDWLRTMFAQRLPELFAAYAKHFAAPLPWKPVVLYSFHDTASSGYSSGGGTLTGLINMTLTGTAWRTESPEAMVQAFYLLAHESAHLWNGQLVASEGGRGSWMHEGGADALTNEMLLAFGMIDRPAWRARREAAINQCAAQVADGPVHLAAQRSQFRTFYDCGFALAIWTEAAMRRQWPSTDLFSFWRELVKVAQGNGSKYDEALYFAVMRESGVADSVTKQMQAFLAGNSIDPVIRGLTSAGMGIGPGQGAPPLPFQQTLARQAFGHVMAAACGRMSFNWGDPIVTVALPACEQFRTSLRVYALEGFRLADQATQAYDAVVAACAANGTVKVQGQDEATIASIVCNRPLKARPVWYEFLS